MNISKLRGSLLLVASLLGCALLNGCKTTATRLSGWEIRLERDQTLANQEVAVDVIGANDKIEGEVRDAVSQNAYFGDIRKRNEKYMVPLKFGANTGADSFQVLHRTNAIWKVWREQKCTTFLFVTDARFHDVSEEQKVIPHFLSIPNDEKLMPVHFARSKRIKVDIGPKRLFSEAPIRTTP